MISNLIRDYIKRLLRILATFRKQKNNDLYSEMIYKAKNVELSEIMLSDELLYIQEL